MLFEKQKIGMCSINGQSFQKAHDAVLHLFFCYKFGRAAALSPCFQMFVLFYGISGHFLISFRKKSEESLVVCNA